MRRNKRKELNIFTMSALDLFASALGAFVLIAVIALPYYLNVNQTDIVKSQKEEIAKLKQSIAALNIKVANSIEEKNQCKKNNKKISRQIDNLGLKNQTLQSTIQKQSAEITSLKAQLKNSIKFSLLGISTKATSFTIVVDMSGSIESYKKTLTQTIKRLIQPMKDKCKIQIIGYNGTNKTANIISWNTPYNSKLYTSGMSRSIDNFIKKIIMNLGGDTPTKEALKEALKYDNEAIILLTDGEPNGDPDRIVDEITKLNNGRHEIHTIAIGDYVKEKKLTEFLINLSSRNAGGFMGVASID